MADGANYSVRYRRKREQKTDYKKRLNLLKSGTTRFVVRPSNKSILMQLVQYEEDGDKVVAHVTSRELKKLGWAHSTSNTPAAYLTGLMCGTKGKANGVEKAILDMGLYPQVKGSKIYGALKGLIDSGVESPADASIFPSEDRLSGKVIASYSTKAKDMEKDFNSIKEKIVKK
ncbi:MAG: 50S ribosomal protein L18 [Candidatus Altiarchaeota archaeon]